MTSFVFLSAHSGGFSSNGLVIVGSLIVIVSYLFNLLAKRYSIPSVLLLILLGMVLHGVVHGLGIHVPSLTSLLEVLGIVGLILIVMEASLDLELTGEKRKLIRRAFFTALVNLLVSASLIALLFMVYIGVDLNTGLLYAVPLSIMSSAIIIPSVSSLRADKREFMVYESTFSDILGIMLFYFLISSLESESIGQMSLSVLLNLSLTVAVSVFASYFLIFLFQKIRTELKLFLLIAVLILLYSLSKMFHLSSLLIILVFGLILSNRQLFFPGRLKNYLHEDQMESIFRNFKMVTLESSFVVRTFFFVIFGFSIVLASLLDFKVWLVSAGILLILYGTRYLYFRFIIRKDILPEVWMAPRGLITILLFYSIPESLVVEEFNMGILLLVILTSSILMAGALIRFRKGEQETEPSTALQKEAEPSGHAASGGKEEPAKGIS
ncbi:MAG: cation:proton antiporter [Bacteroidales bacterium]